MAVCTCLEKAGTIFRAPLDASRSPLSSSLYGKSSIGTPTADEEYHLSDVPT
ncbi:hypothetical protein MMC16_007333 [Acarospora aff. strigata]|nr:hypothetical protein [Acarospora aff. strigata]